MANRVLPLMLLSTPTSKLRFTVIVPWMHMYVSMLFCLCLRAAWQLDPHSRHWHTQRSDSNIIVFSSTRSASFARYDAICGNRALSLAMIASSSFLLLKVQYPALSTALTPRKGRQP